MFTLENIENEYISDVMNLDEHGLLARGDVYHGGYGVAFYFARWLKAKPVPLELLVVLLPGDGVAQEVSIGCHVWSTDEVEVVDAKSLWMDWTPLAIPLTANEARKSYPAAYARGLSIARHIAASDLAVLSCFAK
jgi:hypothetical protein